MLLMFINVLDYDIRIRYYPDIIENFTFISFYKVIFLNLIWDNGCVIM